ncbi:MAG: FAD-dependent monooxygenase [Silvibacterium sp.]
MMQPRPRESRVDALILGGGLAGAALGALLAQQGQAVEIIEKNPAMHHKVCGEFLSHEALFYLERLGINLSSLGAVPIRRLRVAANKLIVECELPFPAMSLSRRALDEALLERASLVGATVLRGRRVESLTKKDSGWVAQLSDGEFRHGSNTFLATGKYDVGGHPRPAGRQNDLVAFKMYFRLAASQQAALANQVELVLFPGGYAGLQLVEDGTANLCLLVTRERLRSCGGQWSGLFGHMLRESDYLAQRLEGSEPLLEKPLAVSSIPYGLLQQHAYDGLWRLGDQAAVIPSFSGDGMAIALHSAHLAARIFLAGGSAESFQSRLCHELRFSVVMATVVSRAVIANPVLAQVGRLWPSLLRHIASGTRIPAHALQR